jgi:AraC-like DNA-binding protein
MEKFQAIYPSLHLQPYVKQYWFLSADELTNGSQRAIPSGYIALSFKRSGEIFSVCENRFLPNACIFGQSTIPNNFHFNSFDIIMVLFQPLGAKVFFDMSMSDFKDQNIDIKDLSDLNILELKDRLMNCFDNQECICWIEQFLSERLSRFDNEKYCRLLPALNLITSNTTDLSKLAHETCLGYKQFKRIFTENIGLNPKEYIQIYRFSKSLNTLRVSSNTTLNDLAYTCGYYDKSHLIKDFKALSGYTPAEFIQQSDPYSPSMSLFQSFFIKAK